MEKKYCVYEHIFPDDLKYVGITCQRPEVRWGINGVGYKGQPVYKAILNYGWDNIKHIILADNLSQTEARELEKEIISSENLETDGWNRHEGGGVGGSPIPMFEYDGKILTSDELAEYATVPGITGHDITTRINSRGWSIEDALTKPKIEKGRLYEYRGNYYTSVELAKLSPVEGMTVSNMIYRLNQHGWDVERAVNQPLDVKLQPKGIGERIYEYQGKMYNSYELTQISPIENLTIGDITCRINHHGWSVEEAIMTPKKNKNIKFKDIPVNRVVTFAGTLDCVPRHPQVASETPLNRSDGNNGVNGNRLRGRVCHLDKTSAHFVSPFKKCGGVFAPPLVLANEALVCDYGLKHCHTHNSWEGNSRLCMSNCWDNAGHWR